MAKGKENKNNRKRAEAAKAGEGKKDSGGLDEHLGGEVRCTAKRGIIFEIVREAIGLKKRSARCGAVGGGKKVLGRSLAQLSGEKKLARLAR